MRRKPSVPSIKPQASLAAGMDAPMACQEDLGISLGSTKLSEYQRLSVLGKGTYGEVHKCVHTPTGKIIAMKTYMFEVSGLQE